MAFLTFNVHKKALIAFCVIAAISAGLMVVTILLGYHKNGSYHTNTSQYLSIFSFMHKDPELTFTSVINFHGSGNFNFNSFSILSIIAVCYKVLFRVSNADIDTYIFWQQVITYCVVLGCTITGFFYERIKHGNS
jgi:hypothetical protein